MDKIKLLSYSVIGLVLLNVGIISFLYISRPNPNQEYNRRRPKDIIIEKLHFDSNQIKKYEDIIKVYRNTIDSLNNNTGNLGLRARKWGNAYINDLSVSSIDVSVNLNPLNNNGGSLGDFTKRWSNAYINNLNIGYLDLSTNLNLLKDSGQTYGCNALYRDFTPNYLFMVDSKISKGIIDAQVYKKCICY